MLHRIIIRLGQTKTTVLLTISTTILSIIISIFAVYLARQFSIVLNIKAAFTISTVVPLIITPIFGWHLIGLMIRINHLESEMRDLATYDSLTGLLRRHAFFEKANFLFQIAKREQLPFSILILDLDNFKEINDLHGHLVGDQFLKELGTSLSSFSRETDLIGRFGGDEFIVFLFNANEDTAISFSNRIRDNISKLSILHNEVNIKCSASIGVYATKAAANIFLDEAMQKADTALY